VDPSAVELIMLAL